jgi:hypothetical protein
MRRLGSIKIWGLAALLLALNSAHASIELYARLLKIYVHSDGVDYAGWQANAADREKLDQVVRWLGELPADASPAQQKAHLINLYNAAMLQAVLDHYPIDSVRSIGLLPFSIFKRTFIRWQGASLSLDQIEKERLLKSFPDPRIHFAINCASRSCPPLRNTPFDAAQLEQQLDAQTRLFADSQDAVKLDPANNSSAFSKLFKWYAADFVPDHPADYLNRYRTDLLPVHPDYDWIAYDWSLNVSSQQSPVQKP